MDRIPLFMWAALERQYRLLYPHPPQALSLADMETISVWYARLYEWRQQQAEQILQIKPGWCAPLLLDNAIAIACVLLGILRGTPFEEVCTWPGKREPQIFALHLPADHEAFLVENVLLQEGELQALVVDSRRPDGTLSLRHILFQHDYQVLFEDCRVRLLSTRGVSLTYQIAEEASSPRQKWWWYTRV